MSSQPQKPIQNPRSPLQDRWFSGCILLLGAVFLTKLIFNSLIPITGDEAYHWEWSRSLAAGYYDHPPLVAYLIRGSTFLLGNDLIGIRFPALLCGLGMMICAGWIAHRHTRSYRAAFFSILTFASISTWNLGATLMTTDAPLGFFGLLSLILLIRAIETRNLLFWVGWGIATGIAIQSKYLGLLIPFATTLLVGLRPKSDGKHWTGLLCGSLFAGLLCLPNIIWNLENSWATVQFHSIIRAESRPFPSHLLAFLGGQIGSLLGVLWVGLICFFAKTVTNVRQGPISTGAPLIYGLTILVVGLIWSFTREVGVHWTALGYLSIIPILVPLWIQDKSRAVRTWFWIGCGLSLTVCLAAQIIMSSLPIQIAMSKSLPEKFGFKKAVGELHGYDVLAQELDYMVRESGGPEPLLLAPNYAQCAIMGLHLQGNRRVWHFGKPSAYGRQYEMWQSHENWLGRDAFYIRDREPTDRTLQTLQRSFQSVESMKKIPVVIGGEHVRTWYVFSCKGFHTNPWQKYHDDPLFIEK